MAFMSNHRRPLSGVGPLRLMTLLGSAYVMALAVGSGHHPWLGLVALLPLLRAIQVLKPIGATVCGSFWGASLFAFSVFAVETAIAPTVASLLLLALIPGVYTGVCSWSARYVGFSPIVDGVARPVRFRVASDAIVTRCSRVRGGVPRPFHRFRPIRIWPVPSR